MPNHRVQNIYRACTMLLLMLLTVVTVHSARLEVPNSYSTIQAAIDASSAGDTIRVYAGTYTGPVNINKSLFVIGSWPDTATTIQAPGDFGTNSGYDYALAHFNTGRTIVHVGTSTPIIVVFQGFIIDGLRLGPAIGQHVGYSGVLAEQCTFTMTGMLIKNILPADSAGSTWEGSKRYNGRGVEVRGEASVAVISGNTFQDINRFHILINATDGSTRPAVFPRATIVQNTIIGKGVYNGGQKGVWFNYGAYGTISQNTISNLGFPNPQIEPDRTSAIVLWSCDANPGGVTTISQNTLTAASSINSKGIYAWGVRDTIRENVITGFRWGIELHSTPFPYVVRNTITGGTIGIMVVDEVAGRTSEVTIGGAPENKNVITGQIDPSAGGRAIALAFRDPLNPETLSSPVPVNATYNDFGVYTASDIRARIFCRGDTTILGPYVLDTVHFTPFAVPKTTLSLKAYLQGPYSIASGSMLNGLAGPGGVLSTHFLGMTIPESAVDSITVELRDSLTFAASKKKFTVPAWLMTDGTIRSFTEGTKNYVEFPDTVSGDFYVVVRHRNHLAVMSSTRVTCEGDTTPTAYDFTTAASKAYGTNAMKELSVGIFALFAGDTGDGQVTGTDFNEFLPKFRAAATGYQTVDWNLDGQVTGTDFNLFDPNFRSARQTSVPE